MNDGFPFHKSPDIVVSGVFVASGGFVISVCDDDADPSFTFLSKKSDSADHDDPVLVEFDTLFWRKSSSAPIILFIKKYFYFVSLSFIPFNTVSISSLFSFAKSLTTSH